MRGASTTKVFHYETFVFAAKWDEVIFLQGSTEPELGHCVIGNDNQEIHLTVLLSNEWTVALHLGAFRGIKPHKEHNTVSTEELCPSVLSSPGSTAGLETGQAGLAIASKSFQVRDLYPCCLHRGECFSSVTSDLCQSLPRESLPRFLAGKQLYRPLEGSASKGFYLQA